MLKGKLDINRITGRDGHTFELRVVCATSGVAVVVCRVDPDKLALALSGFMHQDCEFDHATNGVGMVHQNKTVVVTLPPGTMAGNLTDAQALALLKPYMVDGWEPRYRDGSDLRNGHNLVYDRADATAYRVIFFRLVPPEQAAADPGPWGLEAELANKRRKKT